MSTKEQEVGGPGMGVATVGAENQALAAPRLEDVQVGQEIRHELATLRAAGAALVARQKVVNEVSRMLKGMEWAGGVQGSKLSEETRYAIARICYAYDADPALHINILSGNIYLNAAYWTAELNSAQRAGIIKTWRQENIGPEYAAEMRRLADGVYADADKYKDEAIRDDARGFLRAARYADASRAFHGLNGDHAKIAKAMYETIVEFNDDRDPVREANFAPHAGDPAGSARPSETAKTRSLRRAAVKALPRIRSAEELAAREGVKAEWEIVVEEKRQEAENRAQLASGPQGVQTGGEPAAASGEGAQQLPVEGATQAPTQQAAPAQPTFDRKKARAAFFATLKESGVPDDKRKPWCVEHGFPESTNDWTEADFGRARELLMAPVRDDVVKRTAARSIVLADMMRTLCGKDLPEAYLVDWKLLQKKLDELDAEEQETEA